MTPPENRIRAVLFDWDGTLVNSLDVKIRNAGELFHQELGFSSQKVEDAYRRHSGIPRRQLFDAIVQDLGQPVLQEEVFNDLSTKFSELNAKALTDPALPGLIPASTPVFLKFLQKKGCFLYVSSSASTAELKEIASALHLAHFFLDSGGDIMGSYPGFNKGRDHVSFVSEKHGLSKKEMIFIGDDLSDIRLGHEAGVITIARIGTYSREVLKDYNADAVVETLEEIPVLPGFVFGKKSDLK